LSTQHEPARRAHGSRGRDRHRGGRGGHERSQRGANAKIAPLHPTETPPDIDSFREWELGDAIQGVIANMRISVPTPIQKLAIGPVLAGRDVIAKAETGTGKTLAFGAPMMAKIDPARASVLALVLCPTRELAEQVCKVMAELGAARGVRAALIVGGEPLEPQVNALKAGAQVVVGTPGRVLDLYKQRFLSFPWTEFAVLDEADVMLEIGFIDDVKQILSFTPDERQTLLFSATFPPELLKLAREHTKDPVEVATASGVATVDTIEQSFMKVDDEDRPLVLMRLIEQSATEDVFLVFCDRRTEVDKLMRRLERMPWPVKALHGGYDQEARFRVMSAFRSGEVKALVATDVASRGLDVAHVTHVVNFGAPQDVTDYTHRIGRTGRAGRSGRAITLVTPLGMRRWKRILQDASWTIAETEPPGATRGRLREHAPSRGTRERGQRDARDERGARDARAPREARVERAAREPDQPRNARETNRPGDARESERPPRRNAQRAPWPVDHSEERQATAEVREWRASDDRDRPRSERGGGRRRDQRPREHPVRRDESHALQSGGRREVKQPSPSIERGEEPRQTESTGRREEPRQTESTGRREEPRQTESTGRRGGPRRPGGGRGPRAPHKRTEFGTGL
jgi:superfamily II DNA/RNA helicase